MRINFIKNTRLKPPGQWENSELNDDLRKIFLETMQLEMLSLTASVINFNFKMPVPIYAGPSGRAV
jgi:hypothetical protein